MKFAFVAFVALLPTCAAFAGDVPSGAEWTVRHLSIDGGSPGVKLSGQLAIPRRDGRVPAVLLVAGNGPHTREQTISGCPMFRMISDDLASRGIAVMIVDARGYGFSSGPEELQTTTAERALDARACLETLRRQPEVDAARVGIIGHSEGAMVAMMVAAETGLARFAVLLGVPGEPCGQVWIEQKLAGLARGGATQPTVDAVRAAFDKFVAQAARGFESDAAYYAAGKEVLRAHDVKDEEVADAFVDKILSDLRTPNMRYFLGWDPASYLPRVRVPILAVWGDRDDQVPPARNAPLFRKAASSNPSIRAEVLTGEDHFFLTREGHKPGARHAYGRMHVSPALLDLMAEWITSTTNR